MNDVQSEILKRLKRGQLLTRQQLIDLGSEKPAADIKELRRSGELIVYIPTKTPFWVAPALAEASGVLWAKRIMDRITGAA